MTVSRLVAIDSHAGQLRAAEAGRSAAKAHVCLSGHLQPLSAAWGETRLLCAGDTRLPRHRCQTLNKHWEDVTFDVFFALLTIYNYLSHYNTLSIARQGPNHMPFLIGLESKYAIWSP